MVRKALRLLDCFGMLNKIIVLLLFFFVVVLITQDVKWLSESNQLKVVKIAVEECNAQKQVCITETDEFKLGVLFDRNIFYLNPFNVKVWTENKNDINIESVQIDFKMKNMNMGVNRFLLKKTNFRNEKQKWQGKALLPICVTGRADWVSELEVVTQKSKYVFSFPIFVKQASN